ncbi:spinocerebellar ataxia type 10 protein domain-containing protein [Lipomyces arxii]|uniref:spinocerebellar ataxia type 10 protein domain-containing protein n=1 Tax=Lipomyces arxii TaxID=56418 RepID=UPI0034CEAD98
MADISEYTKILERYKSQDQLNSVINSENECQRAVSALTSIRQDLSSRMKLGSSSGAWDSLQRILQSSLSICCSGPDDSSRKWKFVNAVLLLSMNMLSAGKTTQEYAHSALGSILLMMLTDKSCPTNALANALKIFVNMCAGNDQVKTLLWQKFLEAYDPNTMRDFTDRLDDSTFAILEILMAGIMSGSTERSQKLVSDLQGNNLLCGILDRLHSWSESQDKQNFDFAYSIVTTLITHGWFSDAFKACEDTIDVPSDRQLAMTRVLEGFLVTTEDISPVYGHGLAETLYSDMFCEICKPLCIQIMKKKIESVQTERLASFQTLTLECLTALIGVSADIKDRLIDYHSVEEFLDLLKKADSMIGRRTLKSGLPTEAGKAYEFPDLKRQLVGILALLVEDSRTVQDQIRESGGLPILLSQCNIDDNNPFIREYAILCIKGVLKDNQENQAFVASLEAREAVTTDALHEAGYETSIIDGKVSLKKLSKE